MGGQEFRNHFFHGIGGMAQVFLLNANRTHELVFGFDAFLLEADTVDELAVVGLFFGAAEHMVLRWLRMVFKGF